MSKKLQLQRKHSDFNPQNLKKEILDTHLKNAQKSVNPKIQLNIKEMMKLTEKKVFCQTTANNIQQFLNSYTYQIKDQEYKQDIQDFIQTANDTVYQEILDGKTILHKKEIKDKFKIYEELYELQPKSQFSKNYYKDAINQHNSPTKTHNSFKHGTPLRNQQQTNYSLNSSKSHKQFQATGLKNSQQYSDFWSKSTVQNSDTRREFLNLKNKLQHEKELVHQRYEQDKLRSQKKQEELEKKEKQLKEEEKQKKHEEHSQKFQLMQQQIKQRKEKDQENHEKFQDFYKSYKNKQYLFDKKEQEYQNNQVLPLLQERKKILQEKRELFQPIKKQELIEHEKWYQDLKQQNEERLTSQRQQKQITRSIETPSFYKGKAHIMLESELEQKQREIKKADARERKRKLEVYSQAVQDNFAPIPSNKKHQELMENISELQRDKKKLIKKVIQNKESQSEIDINNPKKQIIYVDLTQVNTRMIGMDNLRYSKQKALINKLPEEERIKYKQKHEEEQKKLLLSEKGEEKYQKSKYQSKYENYLHDNQNKSVEGYDLKQWEKSQRQDDLDVNTKNELLLRQIDILETKARYKEVEAKVNHSYSQPQIAVQHQRSNTSNKNNKNAQRNNRKLIKQKTDLSNNNIISTVDVEKQDKMGEVDDYIYNSMKAKLALLNNISEV